MSNDSFSATGKLLKAYYRHRRDIDASPQYFVGRNNPLVTLLSSVGEDWDIIDIYRRAKTMGFTTPDSKGKTMNMLFSGNVVECILVDDNVNIPSRLSTGVERNIISSIVYPYRHMYPIIPNGKVKTTEPGIVIYHLDLYKLLKAYNTYLTQCRMLDIPKDIRAFIQTNVVLPYQDEINDIGITNIQMEYNLNPRNATRYNNNPKLWYVRRLSDGEYDGYFKRNFERMMDGIKTRDEVLNNTLVNIATDGSYLKGPLLSMRHSLDWLRKLQVYPYMHYLSGLMFNNPNLNSDIHTILAIHRIQSKRLYGSVKNSNYIPDDIKKPVIQTIDSSRRL